MLDDNDDDGNDDDDDDTNNDCFVRVGLLVSAGAAGDKRRAKWGTGRPAA